MLETLDTNNFDNHKCESQLTVGLDVGVLVGLRVVGAKLGLLVVGFRLGLNVIRIFVGRDVVGAEVGEAVGIRVVGRLVELRVVGVPDVGFAEENALGSLWGLDLEQMLDLQLMILRDFC